MERKRDQLSIRKGNKTEIFHKLTSRLVNIEAPSRKIFVEGKDLPFYELINKFLKSLNLVNYHFNLNIMPLPGGGDAGLRNKDTIIKYVKSSEPYDVSEYDTIHTYYGIIDDDNDRLDINQKERKKYAGIKNLLVLKRYSHENYILDPVNIYFYFRSLKDNPKNYRNNKNVQDLLTEIEKKVKDIKNFTQTVSETLLNFKIRNIYEEIQEPTKVAVEEIKNFLQIIVDEVGKNVFDIIFKPNSKYDTLSSITTPILLKWILNMSKPDLDYIKDESSEDDGFIKGTGKKKEILIKGHEALKKFLIKLTTICTNNSKRKLYYDESAFKELEEISKSVSNDFQQILNDFLEKFKPVQTLDESAFKELEEISKSVSNDLQQKLTETILKRRCEEKTEVTVLGIKLEYPKFFTCLRGHDLNTVLKRREIYDGLFNCEKEDIINKFKEPDMGIFIPDEIIEMYKTICHNITYNQEMIDKLIEKKKKMRLFRLKMKESDDEKFIQ